MSPYNELSIIAVGLLCTGGLAVAIEYRRLGWTWALGLILVPVIMLVSGWFVASPAVATAICLLLWLFMFVYPTYLVPDAAQQPVPSLRRRWIEATVTGVTWFSPLAALRRQWWTRFDENPADALTWLAQQPRSHILAVLKFAGGAIRRTGYPGDILKLIVQVKLDPKEQAALDLQPQILRAAVDMHAASLFELYATPILSQPDRDFPRVDPPLVIMLAAVMAGDVRQIARVAETGVPEAQSAFWQAHAAIRAGDREHALKMIATLEHKPGVIPKRAVAQLRTLAQQPALGFEPRQFSVAFQTLLDHALQRLHTQWPQNQVWSLAPMLSLPLGLTVAFSIFMTDSASTQQQVGNFMALGGMNWSLWLDHGEFWRSWSAVWLHADLGHLWGNVLILTVLLVIMVFIRESWFALAVFVLGAILGNTLSGWALASVMGEPAAVAVGASVGVFALMGATIVRLLQRRGHHAVQAALILSMLALILVLSVLGESFGQGQVDHLGHAIGLLLGALAAGLLPPRRTQTRKARWIAGGVTLAAAAPLTIFWGVHVWPHM